MLDKAHAAMEHVEAENRVRSRWSRLSKQPDGVGGPVLSGGNCAKATGNLAVLVSLGREPQILVSASLMPS